MRQVILDTQPIVERYAQYNDLFAFYDASERFTPYETQGIKALIADAVIWWSERYKQVVELRDMELRWMNSFAGQVTQRREAAVDAYLDVNPEAVHQYQMFQQKEDDKNIDLVVGKIEAEVDSLMKRLGIDPNTHHVICTNGWLINDLMVKIGFRGDE